MADPTLKTALADPKLRPLVLAWAQRTHILDEVEFIVDMLQKKEARQIYRDYIADGAPKSINLGGKDLQPARDLVAKGKFKPTELRTLLVDLTQKQFSWIQLGTFATGNNSFLTSPEYKAHLTAGVTRDPKVAAALTSLNLSSAKAKTIEPFITTYLKARTVSDAHAAYVGMQKIAPKAKVDVALTAAGKPAADVVRAYAVIAEKEKNEALGAAQAKQAEKLVASIKTEQTAAKSYLTSALSALKSKGKPKDPIEITRMFNSGRMRVEKATNVYVKAVRLDKGFAAKFPTLAADKKQIDEDWAAYRKALGK
ncbi:MAG: hypothetical protein IT317_13185 [Anaerolineales bacterium]|nr:hypothetical protein [Anaerolineales bacterium]